MTLGLRRLACGVILGGTVLAATSALAQSLAPSRARSTAEAALSSTSEPNRSQKQGKVVRAMRLTGTLPTVDGRLSDEPWRQAEIATDLTQRDPDNGKPMTDATRVQIAYDDRFLYVAVTALDSSPADISTGLGRRDETPPTDSVTISFDARHDHLTGYSFSTNPSSWQGDFTYFDDTSRDTDYNAVWDVRSQITETGWTAEFRIPFSQMRFSSSPDAGQVWGFNVQRYIRRKSETGTWVAKSRGERGEVSFFGHLVFDERLPSPRRLELMPYVLSRGEFLAGGANNGGGATGLDARMGLGTGATLSATINPDFGQVEQDPAVLNLSVFETFFPEKRPFFLEDSRTFVPPYGLFQLFHSRRIGRAPGRLLDANDVIVDKPDETTILGAAKITGKKSDWTYGALTAATGREYADVDTPIVDGAGYTRHESLIEPATSYNVFRLQRDLKGSSNIGALFTGVFREGADNAVTGGFDHNIRWDQNRARWDGHWVFTQAPGVGGVKTSGGGVTNFNVSRKNFNIGTHYDHFGRDFRVNDIGFFRTRANRNQAEGYAEVGQPDPWKIFRRFWGFSSYGYGWTDERLNINDYLETGISWQFLNYWNFNFGGGRNGDVYDDLDTRGGPPIFKPGSQFLFWNANSDSRKRWQLNLGGNVWRNDVGGSGGNARAGLSFQPNDRI